MTAKEKVYLVPGKGFHGVLRIHDDVDSGQVLRHVEGMMPHHDLRLVLPETA